MCEGLGALIKTQWLNTQEDVAARINRRTQPANEPLMLCFGRGELGVGTAYEAPSGPSREINIRKLSVPVPVASPTGDKGKYVDELENVLVRMQFENAESARVLERAVRTVLAGFEQSANEPLTLDELRGMDGEPVWVVFDDNSAMWTLVDAGNVADELKLTGHWGEQIVLAEHKAHIKAIYRRKPDIFAKTYEPVD